MDVNLVSGGVDTFDTGVSKAPLDVSLRALPHAWHEHCCG